jgi:hypothetical protein
MRLDARNLFLWTAVFGLLLVLAVAVRTPAQAESPLPLQEIPNADFTQGDQTPAGWKLEGGQGRWVDKQILEVTGDGRGSTCWRCDGVRFKPGGLYRFEFRARGSLAGGCVISGPSFANHDYHALSSDWKWYGHVFRAPENTDGAYLRIGHWEGKGTLQFDAVRVLPVLPVLTQAGDLVLGEGESIRGGRYLFQGSFDHAGSNFHRVLQSATAGFNSNRWSFGGGNQITYKFDLPATKFTTGQVRFSIGYHTHGACTAEVSRDGKQWRPVATQDKVGAGEAALPGDMLPAAAVWLRLRASPSASNFQVDSVQFEGQLDAALPDATGETCFASVESTSPELAIERISLDASIATGGRCVRLTARNASTAARSMSLVGEVSAGRYTVALPPLLPVQVAPGRTATYRFMASANAGKHRMKLVLKAPDVKPAILTLSYEVPDFYRADYGQLLAPAGKAAVWWCDATWKVSRNRAAPSESTRQPEAATCLSACRNDREAVQIVVRPAEALKGLTAAASALAGPGGAAIAAENVKVLRVYYHYVHTPTDGAGVRDWWPDALPPLDKPIDLPAEQNQPLWVLVHVPKEAKAGDYAGTVTLKAEGFEARVPVKLHVWDFTLPDRNHLETAFGLSPGNVFRYHQLTTEEDKRKVLDLYMQCFAEHRISTYNPVPLDPIRVRWLPEANPPRAEVDFSQFDPAFARAVDKYHVNTYDLPVEGMGGGTFHERYEPAIGKYGEKTPQYQAMFSSYVKQLEDHFRQKGWLEMVYIYWFDEPDPKDYQFVSNGMERLKRYAPGLRRMITEEPGEGFKAPIDIWCPVSFNYNHERAEEERAKGARFWWYVCCGPKAPFCTLFIDHPATELRAWHWQTWQRKILGTLVWEATYWTSEAAYPDAPQNPYEDPMGYVSGYSTPKGVKRYWGNGDGRFVYPPLAAAVPGKSGPGPVLDPPVSSIRWEMIREGVEDYEYLWMLRELIEKHRGGLTAEKLQGYEALLAVPESITKDMTTFTTDPGPIYQRRAAVAAAIEELSKR